jgi:hypothetical protein
MAITSIANVDSEALNLKYLLDGVLERAVSVFQSYNVPLPTRQYWTVGEQAIDCEQLVLTFIQMYLGPPGDQASTPQRCHVVRTAVMTLSLSRSIPTVGQNGRPPSGDTIESAAQIAAVDAWVLMQSVNLFDMWEEGGFGVGVIATVDVPPPEGGFQTINMQLTMAIP